MKLLLSFPLVLVLTACLMSPSVAQTRGIARVTDEYGRDGYCVDSASGGSYDYTDTFNVVNQDACATLCLSYPIGLRGFSYSIPNNRRCMCQYEDGLSPGEGMAYGECSSTGPRFEQCYNNHSGSGPITTVSASSAFVCFRYLTYMSEPPRGTEFVGEGFCMNSDAAGSLYDQTITSGLASAQSPQLASAQECSNLCQTYPVGLRGFNHHPTSQDCYCWYDNGLSPGQGFPHLECPPESPFGICITDDTYHAASGEIDTFQPFPNGQSCYRYLTYTGVGGDPHCKCNNKIRSKLTCRSTDVLLINMISPTCSLLQSVPGRTNTLSSMDNVTLS